jgi:uncharacterized membrane protein (UPF0136 family)
VLCSGNTVESQGDFGVTTAHLSSNKHREYVTNIALTGLVFAPYAISAFLKTFLYPRPYWYFYYDPEIWWYFGGLALANGGMPFIVTHPGGPLYLLTALISTVGSFGPLDFSRFKTIGYMAALPINFIGCLLIIFALRMRALSTRLVAGLLLFLTPQIFEYNTVWSAELFFPAIAGVCVAALFLMTPGKTSIKMVALCSILLGVAASHKLNFAVVGIAYVISFVAVMRYFNLSAVAINGSISVVFQLGGFLIGSAALFTSLPEIFQMILDLFLRQGTFNELGAYGAPPLTTITNNISTYFWVSKPYHILVIFLALSGLVGWYTAKSTKPLPFFLFSLAALIFVFSYLLAGKLSEGGYTWGYKYFMPATVGLIVLFVFWTEVVPERLQRPITLTLILLVGGVVTKQAIQDFKSHLSRIEQNRMMEVALGDALQMAGCNHPNSIVVLSWRAPFEALALRLYATTWPWPLPRPYNEFLKKIEAKFPNIGNIAQWGTNKHLWLPRNLDHWDCLVISDDVRQQISFPVARTKFIESVGEFSILRNDE